MLKLIWMGMGVAAVLLAGCGSNESMPANPYDPPRSGDKDVSEMELIGAISGHMIDARVKGYDTSIKIHVADIMAPVKQQPWSSEATAALDALVRGKHAWVRVYETFREPNAVSIIGSVYVGAEDVGWALVGSGNAWVWESKSNDQELKKLQAWARQHKKGLWALPESEREPPWQFVERRMNEIMKQRERSKPQ
jgi:endonuclease YncB( thermonuclease family)